MYTYKARVVDVYDGDTCRVDIDMGFNLWVRNQSIRWLGINTPEVKGEERERGLVVRNIVRDLILDEDVYLRTEKTGKYGRWLGEFFDKRVFEQFVQDNNHDNIPFSFSINQFLLDRGYAHEFSG